MHWKSASAERVDYVEHQAGAHETVHLVDDAGQPVSAQQAVELKRGILLREQKAQAPVSRREQKRESKRQAKAQAREHQQAIAEARKQKSRTTTLSYGFVMWLVFFIALIANGVILGAVLYVLAAPLLIPVFGWGLRGMFALMR